MPFANLEIRVIQTVIFIGLNQNLMTQFRSHMSLVSNWIDRLLIIFALTGIVLSTSAANSQLAAAQINSTQHSSSTNTNKFLELAEYYRRNGDHLNEAIAWANASALWQKNGQWTEAATAISRSLELLNSQPNTTIQQEILAYALDLQAQAQRNRASTADAIHSWHRAALIYQQLGRSPDWMRLQIEQARALQDIGLTVRACKILLPVLSTTNDQLAPGTCSLESDVIENFKKKSPDEVVDLHILALVAVGDSLRNLGRFEEANIALELASDLSQYSKSYLVISAIRFSQFNLQRLTFEQNRQSSDGLQKRRASVMNAYQLAMRAIAESNDNNLEIQVKVNMFSFLLSNSREHPLDTNESKLLKDIQTSLINDLTQAPWNRVGLYARLHYSHAIIYYLGRLPRVEEINIINQAFSLASQLADNRSKAHTIALLARLSEQSGNFDKADDQLRTAMNLTNQSQSPETAYRIWWQIGQLAVKRHNRNEAIVAYRQAIQILQSIRTDLVVASAESQYSFREQVEPIYRELAGLLLQPNASPNDVDEARRIIEQLQLAELDNFFQDACSTARPVKIDEIDPQAAAIYTIILENRLEVILAMPSGELLRHSVLAPRADIETTLRSMRDSITTRLPARVDRAPLKAGYDWLIRPFESQIQGKEIRNLVFVLDGELRNIPPSALYDGQQYLIEKYVVAIAPGLQFLPGQGLLGIRDRKLLAGGLSEARQGFSALPNVPNEINQVGQYLSSEVLLDSKFNENNLQSRLEKTPFPVIHLATHGEFGSSADTTFLLTWDDRVNSRELNQLFRMPNRDQNPIDLLVLSACSTARGDSRAALGLAGIAVRAGARTTIASLWRVNDASTASLISDFYKNLQERQLSKGEALRRAQQLILNNPETQIPYYWAAFILVGDWQ